MGQRRQIPRRANRALFGDHRNDAVLQHVFDQGDQFHPYARRATPKRQELQRHDQAHDAFRQRRTDAAAVRQDQVAL
ncbi:hypothetical protein D9M68_897710 [compost metagenome]